MTNETHNDGVAPVGLHRNHEAYFVPGLFRGLRVMEVLATERRALSVTEIAQKLSLSKSAVFRLLYTLRHMGFLEMSERKEFNLGPRVLNIGFAYLASKDIIELSRPDLEQLRDETNVSAHMAIRDGREVLYLSCVQTRSGFLSNVNVGTRLPAYASPVGWLMLSEATPREVAALYADVDLAPLTEHTPTSIEALLGRVGEGAGRGYVISRGVVEQGGSTIAAPVLNKDGHVVAAIDISGPDSAFDFQTSEARYVEAVKQTARQISRKLGYLGA